MSKALDWDAAVAFALTLEGAEPGTSYRMPAVKANGRAFLSTGHEAGSFVLALDGHVIEILMATDPDTFWQSPHYAGYAAVLVREGSSDPERVRETIAAAHARAMALPRPRRR